MATEIDFSHNVHLDLQQSFSWTESYNSTNPESFFTLDERELDNLMKTAVTATALDETSIFFGDHNSSPLSSPLSGSSYESQDSPSSDFQPMESSSSDEELEVTAFLHNDQFTDNLGEFGLVLENFACSPLELGAGFGAFVEATGSPFESSCLPPLPFAEQLSLASDDNTDQKPSKKRSRTNSNATNKKEKFTILSPDDLLKLDSKEIEEYIKTLTSKRSLAPSEEKELKRVRRLIKNREYAQSSRNKKKQYMEEMEQKLSIMAQGSAALEKKVKELEVENRTLKIQLSKIGTAMKRDPSLLEKLKQATVTPVAAVPKMKAGAVLFIFLFSFGLFFSPLPQDASQVAPLSSGFSTARKLFQDAAYQDSFGTSALLNRYSRYLPDFVLDFAARHFWTEPDCPADLPDATLDICLSPEKSTDASLPLPLNDELLLFNRRSMGNSAKSVVQASSPLESQAN